MSSNKDLITSIGEMATEKGVETPDTEGKNNAELAGILKDLKAVLSNYIELYGRDRIRLLREIDIQLEDINAD